MEFCPTCERSDPALPMEQHHLQTRRKDKCATEDICRECHKTIHGLFQQHELRDPRLGLDTLEGLLANEKFQKAVGFIRKLPAGAVMQMRQAAHRRGRK